MKLYFIFLVVILCSCNEVIKTKSTLNDKPPIIYRNDSIIIFPQSKQMSGELNSQLMFYVERNGNKPVYYIDSVSNSLYTICFGTSIVSYDLITGKEKFHCLIHSNKYDTKYKISKYKDLIIYQNSSTINLYTNKLRPVGSLFDSLGYKPPFCNNSIADYRYIIANDTVLMTTFYYDIENHKRYDSIKYSFVVDTNNIKLLTKIKNCPILSIE